MLTVLLWAHAKRVANFWPCPLIMQKFQIARSCMLRQKHLVASFLGVLGEIV